MPTVTVDNRRVEVPPGTTILDAAEQLGIEIPTMCLLRGLEPQTSCMVCVVEVAGQANLVPACGARCQEGMVISTDTDAVRRARRTALELLDSDHLGDCLAPCQMICPAGMDIPRMIRQIGRGDLAGAIRTVKRDIPLAGVLGRICPAPCEKGCRRGLADTPISIMRLKRHAADADLATHRPFRPDRKPATHKYVAIVGAGPAGLTTAYYLLTAGHDCTLFDSRDKPGGALRYGLDPSRLSPEVLDADIAAIGDLGAELRLGVTVGKDVSFDTLRGEYDAVLVATGRLDPDGEVFGLETRPAPGDPPGRVVVADRRTGSTSVEGVFAGGDVTGGQRLCVRAVADGKTAAASIDQFLTGREVVGIPRPWTTRIGRVDEAELAVFMRHADPSGRQEPVEQSAGLTAEQARREADRCLHCDCRKTDACKLRRYSIEYGADPAVYHGGRRRFEQYEHPRVFYEPGKCIACGLCVRLTERSADALGMTFVGRGFDVRVAAPLNHSVSEALGELATRCAAACPTGALAMRDANE